MTFLAVIVITRSLYWCRRYIAVKRSVRALEIISGAHLSMLTEFFDRIPVFCSVKTQMFVFRRIYQAHFRAKEVKFLENDTLNRQFDIFY